MKSFFKDGSERQLFAALIGGIGMVLEGCNVGWASPFLYSVKNNKFPCNLTTKEVALIVSLPDIGNIMSPIPTSFLMNWIGRKRTFFLIAIVFEISWVLGIMANGANLLFASRFLGGIGRGMSVTVTPIYLGEIAGTKIRGAICCLVSTLGLSGLLFEHILGTFISIQYLTIASAIIPLIFFFLIIIVPESPHYLLIKNNYKEAYKNYTWLRGLNKEQSENERLSTEKELEDIKNRINQEMENRGRWIDLIKTKGIRRATLTILSISSIQRLSGISTTLSYMVTSLPAGTLITPQQCVIFFTLTLLLTSIVCLFVVDWIGRKPMMFFGGFICAMLQAVNAVYFYLDSLPDFDTRNIQFIPYVSTILYGIVFEAGVGMIQHALLGELFPANVKSKASAAANVCLSLSTFTINYLFPIVTNTFGTYLMFAIFSFFSVLISLITYFFVFETKGKTLGEIQDILNKL